MLFFIPHSTLNSFPALVHTCLCLSRATLRHSGAPGRLAAWRSAEVGQRVELKGELDRTKKAQAQRARHRQ